MSLLAALQNQANALDDYENRINNGMNNFDLEKQMYNNTDLAFKQGKALANQVFTQGQLENLSLAVPAVYGLTKGAYARYKSGKPILPTREEITNSVKNFGRGQFQRGAKATTDKLKSALPDDVAKIYDDKYGGKTPQNLDELQDHINTLKDLAKQKITGKVQEQAQTLSDTAQDIGRRATGKAPSVPPPPDSLKNRPFASAEDLAKPLGPEPGEVSLPSVLPSDPGEGGRAGEGGKVGEFLSPRDNVLQAFHNENVRQFEGFPDSVKDIIVQRMDTMGVLQNEDDGKLNADKLQIHSDILAEAAGQYGLPKAKGLGGAPGGGRGFNPELRWEVSGGQGRLVNKNTGEPVQDLRTLGGEDLAPSQQYRDLSQEADDRTFSGPSRNLAQVLPFEDPDRPQPSIPLGEPQQPTEQQARQARLVDDPASFAPRVETTRPVAVPEGTQPELPDIGTLVSQQTQQARAADPTPPIERPIDQPDETGISALDRTQDRIARTDDDFFATLGADLPAQPPPPPRDQLRTAQGRTADLDNIQQRRDLKGPYGTTADQASGTAPTTQTAEAQPQLRQSVADPSRPLASKEDLAKPLGAEPVEPVEPKVAEPIKTEVDEKVGGKITEDDVGGAAGGVAALGEGVLTATDKGLTGGQKAQALGEQGASLGAFLAGGPELGAAVSGAEILGSNESGAMKAKSIGKMGAELGGAAAASAAIPGAGEVIMGALAIGGLIKDVVDRKKEEKEQTQAQPTAPRQPQVSGIAFDSAPVIDSSDFHQL